MAKIYHYLVRLNIKPVSHLKVLKISREWKAFSHLKQSQNGRQSCVHQFQYITMATISMVYTPVSTVVFLGLSDQANKTTLKQIQCNNRVKLYPILLIVDDLNKDYIQ